MRRNLAGPACALILWAAAGCSFHASEVPGDGVGPNTVTVGFQSSSSLEDESSGTLHLAVELSEPAESTVTVDYAVTGGTATPGADFSGTGGSLTFFAGETSKTIDDVSINQDNDEEGDETIIVTLSGANGAVLGNDTHTVTINANVLPRVQLSTATSSAAENTATMITINLSAPSPTPVIVPYTITGGTATAADFGAATGTVTFPANDTTPQVVSLGVIDDTLNEDDETLVVTLGAVPNAVVGAVATQTHTILDNDPLPVVSFSTAAQAVTEGSGGATTNVTATVALNVLSGRDVTVTLTPTGTATVTADYTFAATTVTIPAGQPSATVTVAVVDDVVAETPETVVLTMTLPTSPHASLGGVQVHTVTINDFCFGAGTATACFDPAPAGATVLPASINTSSDGGPCAATQPPGWIAAGQPASCFVLGNTISMAGTTNVSGTRPLVLVSATTISIGQTLDAASHAGKVGPGSQTCTFPTPLPVAADGAGGGAGGSFVSAGGPGGAGTNGATVGGAAAAAVGAPTVLRGGCRGETGGNAANGDQAAAAGDGGGAVYLVAGTSISISGAINVSGAGAAAGTHFYTGGSGGGSGGMIKLFAPAISNTGTLIANGGGGAQGGDSNDLGNGGFDPSPGSPTTRAAGGSGGNAGGNGGGGFATGNGALAGMAGGSGNGGGGGGGGGGLVEANVAPGGTISAGLVKVP